MSPFLLVGIGILVASFVVLVALLLTGSEAKVASRIERVAPQPVRRQAASATAPTGSLSRVGAALLPEDEGRLSRIRTRMMQAGLYRKHSTALFTGIRVLCMVAPLAVGISLSLFGMMTLPQGVAVGTLVGLLGYLMPALWLTHLKRSRQTQIRRALPDALDVIVVCLEGGLSLSGSMEKVSQELSDAHPLLAAELAIVRREIQLGRTTGEALRQFADRFDAEELRSLASVVIQAERFGASIVKAFRVHADGLRLRRYQQAEAKAQKAPVKLIFPTVLCIFPALYIVLMGPAGVELLKLLDSLG